MGYEWRNLKPAEREELLAWRQARGNPMHSPPRREFTNNSGFLITAACYEHRPYIGASIQRMESFSKSLYPTLETENTQVVAWCVLPNHYHVLIQTDNLRLALKKLGQLHGKTSFTWNGEDSTRGRRIFYRCVDRAMRSERHFWTTVNYIHNNPVRHGYVEHWEDWPWSSAPAYLDEWGREEAVRIWREYPLLDYGESWDPPGL